MQTRLMEANSKQADGPLKEVEGLLNAEQYADVVAEITARMELTK